MLILKRFLLILSVSNEANNSYIIHSCISVGRCPGYPVKKGGMFTIRSLVSGRGSDEAERSSLHGVGRGPEEHVALYYGLPNIGFTSSISFDRSEDYPTYKKLNLFKAARY